MKRIISAFLSLTVLFGITESAAQEEKSPFVTTRGTNFYLPGATQTPYRFIGTNLWYAPILASKGEGSDRERLKKELDALQELGINNLRIAVGSDELPGTSANIVKPFLQKANGKLVAKTLDGLDYLLAEMERRQMYGVFYLNNAWDWSGGYASYLYRTGFGTAPSSGGETYNDYVDFCSQFSTSEKAQELFYKHVKKIVSRTNPYTRKPYKDSPAIMSWQLCNEPRPFSKEAKQGYFQWLEKTARLIKSIDPNHLVSVGSEGYYGCEKDMDLFEKIHAIPEVDYLTIHIWPVNWGWSSRDALYNSLPRVYIETGKYIDMHCRIAQRLNKPLVIEEFGYPRDRNFFTPGTSTGSRDGVYNFVFNYWKENMAKGGPIAGVNFWGWGGEGRPAFTRSNKEEKESDGLKSRENMATWHPGDDYLCDPPHEPQGWYSVFDCDTTTIHIIKQYMKIASPAK